jgi:hypothetical protein
MNTNGPMPAAPADINLDPPNRNRELLLGAEGAAS